MGEGVENLFGTDAQAAGLGGKIGQGGDVLEGDHRANKLWGAGGNDDLSGLDGNDVLLGGSGRDFLSGGNGVDTLKGESGNDVLLGGNGRDFLYGGSGRDTLRGEAGNDVIDGGTGNDFLYGDGGGDLFVFTGNAGHDQIFDFDTHADVIDLTAYNAHVSDVSFFDGADFTTLSLGNMSVQVFGVSSGDLHFGDDILL
ncbi:MAG: calcium-binding protein [Pseudomonadota bacterium]